MTQECVLSLKYKGGYHSKECPQNKMEEQNIDTVQSELNAETPVEVPTAPKLAGKYNSPQDLEKGYKELESKLGDYSQKEEEAQYLREVLNDPEAYKQARISLGLEQVEAPAPQEDQPTSIDPKSVIDEASRTAANVVQREILLNKAYSKYPQLDRDSESYDPAFKAIVDSQIARTDGRKAFLARVDEAVTSTQEYLGRTVQKGIEASSEVDAAKLSQQPQGRQASPVAATDQVREMIRSNDEKTRDAGFKEYLKKYNESRGLFQN